MPAAIATGTPAEDTSWAAVAPASPYTAPTDRSMPPAMSTSVPAEATMMMPACWSRMLARFWVRRKGGLMRPRITMVATNGMRMPGSPDRGPHGVADAGWGSCGCRRGRAHAALVAMPNDAFRIARLGHLVPRELRHDPAGSHDQHPVREAQDLLDLARDEQDRGPACRQVHQQLMDLVLRADVDTPGRLVGHEHTRLAQEGTSEHQLLLVAARQGDRGLLERTRSGDPHEGVAHPRILEVTPHEAEPAEP